MKIYEDRVVEFTDAEAFHIGTVPLDQGFQLVGAQVMNGMLLIAFRRVASQTELTGVQIAQPPTDVSSAPPGEPVVGPPTTVPGQYL